MQSRSFSTASLRRWLPWLWLGLFLAVGLFGRDLWKPDEPYSFGMMWNFAQGHDWIVPYVGSTPFVEKPPLFYWLGALTGLALAPWLPFHVGVHVATLACLGLMLWVLARAASVYGGEALRWPACAVLVSTVGAVFHLHKSTADIAQMCGAVIALYGLMRMARADDSARAAGLWLGSGTGIAFLAKGLLVPAILFVTCAVVLLTRPRDVLARKWHILTTLGWATLAAIPWFCLWPYLLWHEAPGLFDEWFWRDNVGRFTGSGNVGDLRVSYWQDALSVMLLSLPAGLWIMGGLWGAVRRLRGDESAIDEAHRSPGHTGFSRVGLGLCKVGRAWQALALEQVVVFGYVVACLVVLFAAASIREVYLLPLYPALALLAAPSAARILPSRVLRVAILVLSGIVALYGVVQWGLLVAGKGLALSWKVSRWLPVEDFGIAMQPFAVLATIALAVPWCWVIWRRGRVQGATFWLANIALIWGVMHALLLPWLDAARGYGAPLTSMRAALPPNTQCIATVGVGESERALVQYWAGAVPIEVGQGNPQESTCGVLLLMDKSTNRLSPPAPYGGALLWQGGRPGDDNERLRLFARDARG